MKTHYNVPVGGEMKKAENPHTDLNNAVFKKKDTDAFRGFRESRNTCSNKFSRKLFIINLLNYFIEKSKIQIQGI